MAVADPNLELRTKPGFVLLAMPALLPSVISFFSLKIRGGGTPPHMKKIPTTHK